MNYQEWYEEFSKEMDPNELSVNTFGLLAWNTVDFKYTEINRRLANHNHDLELENKRLKSELNAKMFEATNDQEI